jgi:3-hydroxybutyryl-CoA dehydrogenase
MSFRRRTTPSLGCTDRVDPTLGEFVPYTLPGDIDQRPVAVVGAGTLGARIALMFAAGGSHVRIFNRTLERAEAARAFVHEELSGTRETLGLTARPPGEVEVVAPMERAVSGAWLAIESLAEDRDLKRRILGALDAAADDDAVLATNSSSYPSSQLIDEVTNPERVLNMHFLMPPAANAVELMSCGRTEEAILDALSARLPRYGLSPYRVQRESVGFIFNRIWAAIKREALMVVEEGVATPADVDRIWQEALGTPFGPFRAMDAVGLDVVLDIEEHYAEIRADVPEGPRRLLRDYLDQGHRGVKSGQGFYGDYGSST